MARTLIAYYSMSGHTRTIANELREATGADVEEIVEPHPRHGFGGMVRAMVDAVARRKPPISPPTHDPADYDVVAIGGPVWAGRMASPVRTYAQQFGGKVPHIVFFCTEGGRGADTAFADLEKICGHAPEATLVVDAAHMPAVEHHAALSRFASRLSAARH